MASTGRIIYGALAAAAAVAVALGAAGCAERPQRSVEAVGSAALERYQEKAAASAAAESKAPGGRFAALGKPEAPASAPPSPAPASDAGQPAGQAAAAPGTAVPGQLPSKPPSRLAGFTDPLARTANRIPVTLESCLRRALANNLGIQIARFGPAISETAVVEAEALFDPSWFMNNALSRIRQDAGTALAGATTLVARQWEFATGVDALLPTGATISLGQDWTSIDSNSAFFDPNPQYASALGVMVRQPLLRGAGLEATKSPIVLARLDHTISLADFKVRVMDKLLEVETAYWDLVVAETQIQALTEALEAAKENQRIAQRRVQEGADKRIVLSLADSAVTSRQTDLVVARLRLARTSDRLKRQINDRELPLEEPVLLEPMELPLTTPMPVSREVLQASMVAAMRSRPEMDQAEAALTKAGVRERVARRDRLPQLDLAAGYRYTGLDADLDPAFREQFETRFYDWTAGLEFRVPIGNRARAAAHERTQLEQARALYEREDTRQRVLLEVSEAVRNLGAAEEAILATRAARQAAEQTLHDQQANVAAGAALVKDLLEAQRDLADAKVREMEAMAAYMASLAGLERAKGTLLDYNNVSVLEDEPEGPPAAPPAK